MKKIFFCFFASSLFIIASCSNDSDHQNNNSILPKTITSRDSDNISQDITTINYDGNKIVNLLAKSLKIDYSYEGDKIVTQRRYYLNGEKKSKYYEATYSYANDKLHKVSLSDHGREKEYVYTYNNDGTIKKQTYELGNKISLDKNGEEIFFVVDGNIVKSEYNWGGDQSDIVTTCIYEYDLKNNVFKNITGLNLLLDQADFLSEINIFSGNNVIRHKVSTIQGPLSNIQFEFYSNKMKYEYNKKGYPTKKITYDYTGRIINIIEYTY